MTQKYKPFYFIDILTNPIRTFKGSQMKLKDFQGLKFFSEIFSGLDKHKNPRLSRTRGNPEFN